MDFSVPSSANYSKKAAQEVGHDTYDYRVERNEALA